MLKQRAHPYKSFKKIITRLYLFEKFVYYHTDGAASNQSMLLLVKCIQHIRIEISKLFYMKFIIKFSKEQLQ